MPADDARAALAELRRLLTVCPFCGAAMQYSESGRYAEWVCTNPPCQGHAAIPLARLAALARLGEGD